MALLPPVHPRAVLAGLLLSLLALAGLLAFAGLYDALFPLLVGWILVFVLVAKRLARGSEADGGRDEERGARREAWHGRAQDGEATEVGGGVEDEVLGEG